MSDSCIVPVNFPAAITNRPSLPRIAYRIGQYSDFRAKLLSLLDQSPLLQSWTHRQPDDPGIALLEGAAILGDILTFYQELYANEAWLGTAQWPESIAALARLIGYRAAPGLGGQGYAAFEIRGDSPSVVPAGFPLSAQITGGGAPANFETAAGIVALPGLSSFALYAPSAVPGIYAGATLFGADAGLLATAKVTLKVNDRLMLVDGANVANRQIAIVTKLATVLDQTVITIAGAWQFGNLGGAMTAYKLGRTFRAFGYNAPATQFSLNSANTLESGTVDTGLPVESIMEGFPLERQVDDLSAGITMLVDLQVTPLFGATSNSFSAQTAISVKSDTDSVGPMQGGITRVAFKSPPPGPPEWWIYELFHTDRRTALCYEVIGAGFGLTGVREPIAAPAGELDYWGDGASYQALDTRLLQFISLNPDDTAARVEEASCAIDRTQFGDGAVAVRRLTLTPALSAFTLADFPFTAPAVTVLGNVVPITQGKTQPVAVLGNGDARQIYQSFQLPKAPLTWLPDEASAPPCQPQLSLLVNQIQWSPVDTLFASGPNDQVYILREDSAGNHWAQFGDGVNGAALPSGVGNVTATYRTGNAANGWRQSGAKPQANGSVANLANLRLYNEITGGTADEDAGHIRQSAPGRVEELGRIVSLQDFEFEALSISGVEKAQAVWDIAENTPLLQLTVLLSDDTPAQIGAVQAAISAANVARGANRFPVLVVEASLEYVYLAVTIGLLAGYQPKPVQAAIAAALSVLPADGSAPLAGGLFCVDQRSLGEPEYASRIEGVIQNVPGVAWAQVTGLGPLGTAIDPSTLTLPATPALAPNLACAGNRVLALYAAHFLPLLGAA